MALVHEFLILTPEITSEVADKVMDRELWEFFLRNRKKAVWVHDIFVLPNIYAFDEVNTIIPHLEAPFYKHTIHTKGLNYYAETVFLPDSLPVLCKVLRSISIGKEFAPVIELCEKAYESHLAVLHIGV